MKLIDERLLLKKEYRINVIKTMRDGSNQRRKVEAKKRHDVYKDETIKHVLHKLKSEGLDPKTVQIMENRAANISICRKVIDKVSRSYNGGVQRDTGSESGNIIVQSLIELLDWDAKHKKADRYRKLFKNCFMFIVPESYDQDGREVYKIKMKVLAPWQYDVLEDPKDCEKIACLIMSDYVEESAFQGKTYYIFWSKNLHFTCDENGDIVASLSPDDLINPIGEIPGVSYAEDQDGSYWASGGRDLVDGSILVNTLITDMFAIMFVQGWGQFVITGQKIPSKFEVGPHNALVMTYEEGMPEPKVTVVSANPPIGDWMSSIEQYVALLLSTNNLSPGNVAVKLDAANFPSGIAMLIEKSEATAPVEEAQKQFRAGEKREFEIVKKWQNHYAAALSLDDDFAEIGVIPEELKPVTKFVDTREVTTEKEKLENIKTRQGIGLNTEIELLMLDRPDMSAEEAKKKLLEIAEEKMKRAVSASAKTAEELINKEGKEAEVDESKVDE